MPRFSIRQLLLATALVAVGIVALRSATSTIAEIAMGLVLATLAAAVLLAVYRDGQRRAFWVGFSFIGWLYLALCFVPIFGSDVPLGWSRIVTGKAAGALHSQLFLRTRVQPALPPNFYGPPPGTTIQYFDGPGYAEFLQVAHTLWTVLLATCGGWFAAWLHAARTKPASGPKASER
jgi:hypothetical protein